MEFDPTEAALAELLALYEQGLFTDGEVISHCMRMLAAAADDAQRTILWVGVPDWARSRISANYARFDYDRDEFVNFRKSIPTDIELLKAAQRWFNRRAD